MATAELFAFEDHGSVALVRPTTAGARDWLEATCEPEPWQWFGGALAVEPRAIPGLLALILESDPADMQGAAE